MDTKHLSGYETIKKLQEGIFPEPSMFATIPMKITFVEKGGIEFQAIAGKNHLNPMGGVHGGFAAAVLDTATGAAVHTVLEPGESYGTIDLNVKMMRPVPVGTSLVVNRSARVGVPEARLVDKAGKIYAHATSTCMIIKKETNADIISINSHDVITEDSAITC